MTYLFTLEEVLKNSFNTLFSIGTVQTQLVKFLCVITTCLGLRRLWKIKQLHLKDHKELLVCARVCDPRAVVSA